MIRNNFVLAVLIIFLVLIAVALVRVADTAAAQSSQSVTGQTISYNYDWRHLNICIENGLPLILHASDSAIIYVDVNGNVFKAVPNLRDGSPLTTWLASGAHCNG